MFLELDSAIDLFKLADFVRVVIVFVFVSDPVASNKRCSDLDDHVSDIELFRIGGRRLHFRSGCLCSVHQLETSIELLPLGLRVLVRGRCPARDVCPIG